MITEATTANDFAAILAVDDAEIFEQYFPSDKNRVIQWFVDMRNSVQQASVAAWMCVINSQVTGYMLAVDCQMDPLDDAVIVPYYWHPNGQQHDKFLETVRVWAQERGAKCIRIICDGTHAAFYKRYGFSSSGHIMECLI